MEKRKVLKVDEFINEGGMSADVHKSVQDDVSKLLSIPDDEEYNNLRKTAMKKANDYENSPQFIADRQPLKSHPPFKIGMFVNAIIENSLRSNVIIVDIINDTKMMVAYPNHLYVHDRITEINPKEQITKIVANDTLPDGWQKDIKESMILYNNYKKYGEDNWGNIKTHK